MFKVTPPPPPKTSKPNLEICMYLYMKPLEYM